MMPDDRIYHAVDQLAEAFVDLAKTDEYQRTALEILDDAGLLEWVRETIEEHAKRA